MFIAHNLSNTRQDTGLLQQNNYIMILHLFSSPEGSPFWRNSLLLNKIIENTFNRKSPYKPAPPISDSYGLNILPN